MNGHAAWFSAVLGVMAFFGIAIWETLAPSHDTGAAQGPRWVRSASLYGLGLVASSLCFPIAASSVVDWARLNELGLFNQLPLPTALAAVMGVLLLDLGDYLTHRMMHAVPVLWRFHQTHHSDLDFDCGTHLLHHPMEVLIAGTLLFAHVVLWGLPYESVLAFALLSVVAGPWQHGNLRLPVALQRCLGTVLVTPEMHKVHHSSVAGDGNRNFSIVFPWWDSLFGTYANGPSNGWHDLRFGLADRQNPCDVTFFKLLFEPFGLAFAQRWLKRTAG
jgi:sterol desaturase/sphingolipid hydroxylase (fatty acid hydroxylase superfamily)